MKRKKTRKSKLITVLGNKLPFFIYIRSKCLSCNHDKIILPNIKLMASILAIVHWEDFIIMFTPLLVVKMLFLKLHNFLDHYYFFSSFSLNLIVNFSVYLIKLYSVFYTLVPNFLNVNLSTFSTPYCTIVHFQSIFLCRS